MEKRNAKNRVEYLEKLNELKDPLEVARAVAGAIFKKPETREGFSRAFGRGATFNDVLNTAFIYAVENADDGETSFIRVYRDVLDYIRRNARYAAAADVADFSERIADVEDAERSAILNEILFRIAADVGDVAAYLFIAVFLNGEDRANAVRSVGLRRAFGFRLIRRAVASAFRTLGRPAGAFDFTAYL